MEDGEQFLPRSILNLPSSSAGQQPSRSQSWPGNAVHFLAGQISQAAHEVGDAHGLDLLDVERAGFEKRLRR